MRRALVVTIVVLTPIVASAEQDVLKYAFVPGSGFGLAPCIVQISKQQGCFVTVYDTGETTSKISNAKAEAIKDCQEKIDVAKGQLVDSINKLSPQVVETIRAQVKEEIKAEVIKELADDIRSGKVKVQVGSTTPAKKVP